MTQQFHFWVYMQEKCVYMSAKRHQEYIVREALFLIAPNWKHLKCLFAVKHLKKQAPCAIYV